MTYSWVQRFRIRVETRLGVKTGLQDYGSRCYNFLRQEGECKNVVLHDAQRDIHVQTPQDSLVAS